AVLAREELGQLALAEDPELGEAVGEALARAVLVDLGVAQLLRRGDALAGEERSDPSARHRPPWQAHAQGARASTRVAGAARASQAARWGAPGRARAWPEGGREHGPVGAREGLVPTAARRECRDRRALAAPLRAVAGRGPVFSAMVRRHGTATHGAGCRRP